MLLMCQEFADTSSYLVYNLLKQRAVSLSLYTSSFLLLGCLKKANGTLFFKVLRPLTDLVYEGTSSKNCALTLVKANQAHVQTHQGV